jgi:hypothetical protein
MDEVDKAIEAYKPDSWKGYTIGDPLADLRGFATFEAAM